MSGEDDSDEEDDNLEDGDKEDDCSGHCWADGDDRGHELPGKRLLDLRLFFPPSHHSQPCLAWLNWTGVSISLF